VAVREPEGTWLELELLDSVLYKWRAERGVYFGAA
jgi:hypothetical protein